MRAVWSFWTPPFLAERRSSWASDLHHWLAWGLSLAAAEAHYPDTQLVTDDAGARLLIDALDLPFAHVSTALNTLRHEDPGWWSLGKLRAYRLQTEPFIHIDTDVFLWDRLRPDLEAAPLLAQNPEPITFGDSCYRPHEFDQLLNAPHDGWLPREWSWYRRAAPFRARAECCGIFGGNRVDFIHDYAAKALRLISGPRNHAAWRRLPNKHDHMILVEQYLLTAAIEYHRHRPNSRFDDVSIRYVFDSLTDAYRPERAAEAGYTHLAAAAKRDPAIAANLEARVAADLPGHYVRCMDLAAAPIG
jgi:hypothetical protein